MTTYLTAWALCLTVGSFVVLAVVIGLAIRDHRAAAEPAPVPAPRIPGQRQPTPSAAVIVHALDVAAFDDFLRELILTPHVEEVLA